MLLPVATIPLLSDPRWSSLTPLQVPGLTLTSLMRVWLLPSAGGWKEPTLTREVCGEAQGQKSEQWGALHLFEMKWKQLRALLTPISAQEPGLAQGILPAPRKCGSNQPWQCLSEQSTQQEDISLLELSFTAQRHLPAQPGLSAASVLA